MIETKYGPKSSVMDLDWSYTLGLDRSNLATCHDHEEIQIWSISIEQENDEILVSYHEKPKTVSLKTHKFKQIKWNDVGTKLFLMTESHEIKIIEKRLDGSYYLCGSVWKK